MDDPKQKPSLVTQMLESIGAAEYLQRFKFGGVVGKMTVIGLIGLVVIGIIGRNLVGNWAVLGGITLAASIIVFVVQTIYKFADRHPELALFEGAELLRWQQMQIEAKGMQAPKSLPPVPEQPALVPDNDKEQGGGQ